MGSERRLATGVALRSRKLTRVCGWRKADAARLPAAADQQTKNTPHKHATASQEAKHRKQPRVTGTCHSAQPTSVLDSGQIQDVRFQVQEAQSGSALLLSVRLLLLKLGVVRTGRGRNGLSR